VRELTTQIDVFNCCKFRLRIIIIKLYNFSTLYYPVVLLSAWIVAQSGIELPDAYALYGNASQNPSNRESGARIQMQSQSAAAHLSLVGNGRGSSHRRRCAERERERERGRDPFPLRASCGSLCLSFADTRQDGMLRTPASAGIRVHVPFPFRSATSTSPELTASVGRPVVVLAACGSVDGLHRLLSSTKIKRRQIHSIGQYHTQLSGHESVCQTT